MKLVDGLNLARFVALYLAAEVLLVVAALVYLRPVLH